MIRSFDFVEAFEKLKEGRIGEGFMKISSKFR